MSPGQIRTAGASERPFLVVTAVTLSTTLVVGYALGLCWIGALQLLRCAPSGHS